VGDSSSTCAQSTDGTIFQRSDVHCIAWEDPDQGDESVQSELLLWGKPESYGRDVPGAGCSRVLLESLPLIWAAT
jgi:hypothetical protein